MRLTGLLTVAVVALWSVGVLDAQRPSLGTLDERLTIIEQRPSPEAIGMLRWFPARLGITLLPNATPNDIAFDGDHIWIANAGALVKMRASDGLILNSVGVLGGSGTASMAFDGAHIWVAESFQERVLKLRASDFAVVGNFPVDRPSDVVYDGTYIWITQEFGTNANSIRRLLASDGTPQGDFPVGFQPLAAAFDGAHIWVANGSNSTVTKLRASDGALVATIPVGGTPNGLAFDGTHMWVTCSGSDDVRKIRASDNVVVGTFAAGVNPFGAAFDGHSVWVANAGATFDTANDSVTKLRASDGAHIGTFDAGDNPRALAFDGANIWVANRGHVLPGGARTGSLNKM
jgi:hypothetical protein